MEKFVAIKAVLNLGLSEKLVVAFPNIVPVERPLVINQKIGDQDPHWLVGFTTADAGWLFL